MSQPTLNPTTHTREELEVLAFTIAGLMKEFGDKPMSAKQAYNWMGIGKTKFMRLVNEGVIKGHLKDNGAPVYLKSEIIEAIKKS